MKHTIEHYLPKSSILSSKNSNKAVIDRLGDAVIRQVVISILKGGNLRDLTEVMTRKRILLSNVALLVVYFKMYCDNTNLEEELTSMISNELDSKTANKPQEKKDALLAFIGMTRKGWDNIVRRDKGKKVYLEKLDESLREIENDICKSYGEFSADFYIGNQKCKIPTVSLLRCMMALGSQTLAIRGSEKSIYGKLFERLVLGSVLSILGFRKVDRNDGGDYRMVFWLSDNKNSKRECDATALVSSGASVRFDIGFIGRGNPEISLDKVTRYEHMLEFAGRDGKKHIAAANTIIIVDTIGDGSKIREMAERVGGKIIQMNGSYWVKELSDAIKALYSDQYEDLLENISQKDTLAFIEKKMCDVKFEEFLSSAKERKKKEMKILSEAPSKKQFKEYLPVYSMRVACGEFGDGVSVEPSGWIKVSKMGKLDNTMMVVRAVHDSMEPLIHDGDYCIVRKLGTVKPMEQVVLVQRNDNLTDPETGGAYLFKKLIKEGGKEILHSLNTKYPDIVVAPNSGIKIVAYFHAVIK